PRNSVHDHSGVGRFPQERTTAARPQHLERGDGNALASGPARRGAVGARLHLYTQYRAARSRQIADRVRGVGPLNLDSTAPEDQLRRFLFLLDDFPSFRWFFEKHPPASLALRLAPESRHSGCLSTRQPVVLRVRRDK